jgi:hypothetical protein
MGVAMIGGAPLLTAASGSVDRQSLQNYNPSNLGIVVRQKISWSPTKGAN